MKSSLTNRWFISINISSIDWMFSMWTLFITTNRIFSSNFTLIFNTFSSLLTANFVNFGRVFESERSEGSSKCDRLYFILRWRLVFIFTISDNYNDGSTFRFQDSSMNSRFTDTWLISIYHSTNNLSRWIFIDFRAINSKFFSCWTL